MQNVVEQRPKGRTSFGIFEGITGTHHLDHVHKPYWVILKKSPSAARSISPNPYPDL